MKFSVLLNGCFLFLLLLWNSSGFESAVTSMCSDDWLLVRMKKRPFDNDTEVRMDDIHLGENCSVTRTLVYNYEFSYPVFSCGIKKFVSDQMLQGNDIFILSVISYRSTLGITHKFQVFCFVKRLQLSSLAQFGMIEYSFSTMIESSQETKGEQSTNSSKREKCEINFNGYSKDQPSMNHCTNNACAETSFAP